MSYDEAVTALYQASHGSFVAERQRIGAQLKGNGDKTAALKFAKLTRPPISAWAVNQLWWHAREDFEQLFETAAMLRAGKLSASGAHRKALAKLGARAATLLTDGGHSSSEATLRRITMTLAGLAANGGFAPEPAGALAKDRDPPGFEAFGSESWEPSSAEVEHTQQPVKSAAKAADTQKRAEEKRRQAAAAKRAQEAAAAESQRAAAKKARQQAERREREAALRDAKQALGTSQREHTLIAERLAVAERELERAQKAVELAQARLLASDAEERDV